MNIEDKFALCLGVSMADAYLLTLDDPISVTTRTRRHNHEDFIVGKWYRKERQQSKQYQKTDEDIIPTYLIHGIDLYGNGKTTIQLLLPVFFPPALVNIPRSGHSPLEFKDANFVNTPICPLFGPEGVECLPSVKLSQGPVLNIYSNELYALNANVSYKVGQSPEWDVLDFGQLEPWNYDECSFMSILCMESRIPCLLVDHFECQMASIHSNILLDKQGELMIAASPERMIPGTCRLFWPMKLDYVYQSPVVIALDCPQNGHSLNSQPEFVFQKLENEEYHITWKSNPFHAAVADSSDYSISWLGKLTDPFSYIGKKLIHVIPFTVKANCILDWDLRCAAWLVRAIISQRDLWTDTIINDDTRKITATSSSSSGVTRAEGLEAGHTLVNGSYQCSSSSGTMLNGKSRGLPIDLDFCKKILESSININVDISNSPTTTTLAVKEDGSYEPGIGTASLPSVDEYPRINLTKTVEKTPEEKTTPKGKKYTKGNFDDDCTDSSEEDSEDDDVQSDIFHVRKRSSVKIVEISQSPQRLSLTTQIEDGSPPTIANQFGQTRKDLVVFLAIRRDNGDYTFLIFDENAKIFTHRVYAKPSIGISGIAAIGSWYRIKYTIFGRGLVNNARINLQSIGTAVNDPPIETRVKNGILAQFNLKAIFMNSWHDPRNDHTKNKATYNRYRLTWWPELCSFCFPPSADETSNSTEPTKLNANSLEYRSPDLSNLTNEDLLVFLTVHNDSGNSVFLLFNGSEGIFTHRVYADPPEWIHGNPEVGKWYKMDANLNINSLTTGERIDLPSVGAVIVNPPIETRVKDGVAQFNTTERFQKIWHKYATCFDYSLNESTSQWWPELCQSCYPQIVSIPHQEPVRGVIEIPRMDSSPIQSATSNVNRDEMFLTYSQTGNANRDTYLIDAIDAYISNDSGYYELSDVGLPNTVPISDNLRAESHSPNLSAGTISGAQAVDRDIVLNSPAESPIQLEQKKKNAEAPGRFGYARRQRDMQTRTRHDDEVYAAICSEIPSTSTNIPF